MIFFSKKSGIFIFETGIQRKHVFTELKVHITVIDNIADICKGFGNFLVIFKENSRSLNKILYLPAERSLPRRIISTYIFISIPVLYCSYNSREQKIFRCREINRVGNYVPQFSFPCKIV